MNNLNGHLWGVLELTITTSAHILYLIVCRDKLNLNTTEMLNRPLIKMTLATVCHNSTEPRQILLQNVKYAYTCTWWTGSVILDLCVVFLLYIYTRWRNYAGLLENFWHRALHTTISVKLSNNAATMSTREIPTLINPGLYSTFFKCQQILTYFLYFFYFFEYSGSQGSTCVF